MVTLERRKERLGRDMVQTTRTIPEDELRAFLNRSKPTSRRGWRAGRNPSKDLLRYALIVSGSPARDDAECRHAHDAAVAIGWRGYRSLQRFAIAVRTS